MDSHDSPMPLPGSALLAYEEFGRGTPVLLLHGLAGTARAHFDPLIAELSAHHRVIAPDLRGHGGSRDLLLPNDETLYTTHVEDVARLIERLNLSGLRLIGYSDGGEVAIMVAARLSRRVHSICLWGVSGRIPPPEIVEFYAHAEDFMPNWGTFRAELEQLHGTCGELILARWVEAARKITARGGDVSLEAALKVECSALIVSGDNDPFNPLPAVRELVGRLKNAHLIVLPGAKHDLLQERRPQLVTILKRFLSDTP